MVYRSIFASMMAVILSFACMASATAHKDANGIVKIRMDSMRTLKYEVKLIDDMLSGKKYLSKKRLARSLSKIMPLTGVAMLKLFPKGSHMKLSEADPVIWQSWEDFGALAVQLELATKKLETSLKAKSSTKILSDDYLKIRAACKSCHDRFRL